MSDASPLAEALASHPEVSVLTGYVVAYSYLDEHGEMRYGVRFGGQDRTVGLMGLTVIAQQELFKANEDQN